jgi:regulatory protein
VRSIKYENSYQLKTKLLRYGLSLGFPMEQVMASVEQVIKNINFEDQCDEDILF